MDINLFIKSRSGAVDNLMGTYSGLVFMGGEII